MTGQVPRRPITRRRLLCGAATALIGAPGLLTGCSRDAPADGAWPSVIRVGGMAGRGSRVGTGALGVAQHQGLIEQAFADTDTRIEWLLVDSGGTGIMEAVANRLIDFSLFSVLAQIIARARGVPATVVAANSYQANYLAVRSGLPIQGPADLKGRRVGVTIGAIGHLGLLQLLDSHGLSVRDVTLVNMNGPETMAALAAGEVDATLGGANLFQLETRGLVRIVYTSYARRTRTSGFASVLVHDEFHRRHPLATRRLLKAYVQAVHWMALPENFEAYAEFSNRGSTTPMPLVHRYLRDVDLKNAFNPLIDDYYLARFRESAAVCLDAGLIREPVHPDRWIDRQLVYDVVDELGLGGFWSRWDAHGEEQA